MQEQMLSGDLPEREWIELAQQVWDKAREHLLGSISVSEYRLELATLLREREARQGGFSN